MKIKNLLKTKRIFALSLAIVLGAGLFGCTEKEPTSSTKPGQTTASGNNGGTQMTPDKITFDNNQSYYNFHEPADNDEVIVMEIENYGTVKIRLFPDLVPEAVENFVTHAKNGYYDGLTFHRVISEFMIQGGDPKGTGTGGESIWGGKFDSGMTTQLHHFTGALAYANSGSTATTGSQFYICVYSENDEATLNQLISTGYTFSDEVKAKYAEVGGPAFLDKGIYTALRNEDGTIVYDQQGYTVFGQVFEGQNIVEAVSKVQTGQSDKPTKAVIMKTVQVKKYSEVK
jgi:cyclophilin family peptidyl-prolyl cis-trans isomerase